MPILAKILVPYCKPKSQLIQHFNMVHPRDISLAESRGSSSFFTVKSAIRLWYRAVFRKPCLLRPTLHQFYCQRGNPLIWIILVFHTHFYLIFMLPIHFWHCSSKNLNLVLPCCGKCSPEIGHNPKSPCLEKTPGSPCHIKSFQNLRQLDSFRQSMWSQEVTKVFEIPLVPGQDMYKDSGNAKILDFFGLVPKL